MPPDLIRWWKPVRLKKARPNKNNLASRQKKAGLKPDFVVVAKPADTITFQEGY
jgi:hypothetical protein